MKIKRFTVANMQAGLAQINEMLGPEAVILSNRRLADGLEIVAGVDEQEYERYLATQPSVSGSDIIKAEPARAAEPLDQETMAELFSVMADKNRQAFAATQPPATASAPQPTVASPSRPRGQPAVEKTPIAAAWDGEALHSLRQEIDGLKSLLKEQTEQLKEPASLEMTPQYERLEARLTALGFGYSATRRLMQAYDREDTLDMNWRRLMARLASALPVSLYEPLATGGVYALAGPTGAGKTTTVAKLAALGVRDFGADNVAVVSMDWFQAGGQEMLTSVAGILGVECVLMQESDQLATVLARLAKKRLVLIDTSGSAKAMGLWSELMAKASLASKIKTLLVLPATMHGNAVSQFMSRLQAVVISGTILSKVDETGCFGSMLEPILRHHWPLWYVTTGQQIPQDIEFVDVKALIKRLVQGLKAEPVSYASVG